ncbi:hypothetical protein HY478_01945 [Candidatus Uhrbacteria bacterium]|nr:hypothetical protein [Candidatus Uhrbacteria bacterium]
MGAIERFLAVLLEHLNGAFPLWLAPVQVKVLTISNQHDVYADEIGRRLEESGIRAEVDASNETLGKKVRDAKIQKIPYIAVVGNEEVKTKTATLESRTKGKLGALAISEIISKLQEENRSRRA